MDGHYPSSRSGRFPGMRGSFLHRDCARSDIIGIIPFRLIGDKMADIVLRNLDDDLKERLRQSAARHKRSMNAELREIVRTALTSPYRASNNQLKKLAADIRALRAGRPQTPSEILLRESREDR